MRAREFIGCPCPDAGWRDWRSGRRRRDSPARAARGLAGMGGNAMRHGVAAVLQPVLRRMQTFR